MKIFKQSIEILKIEWKKNFWVNHQRRNGTNSEKKTEMNEKNLSIDFTHTQSEIISFFLFHFFQQQQQF